MKISMTLQVEDSDDLDPSAPTGLTTEAYDRLYNAVTDAGFAVEGDPRPVS